MTDPSVAGGMAIDRPSAWRVRGYSLAVFWILFALYQVDRIPGLESPIEHCERLYLPITLLPLGTIDAYTTDDSTPHLLLGRTALEKGRFSLTTAEASAMLRWKYQPHASGPSRILQLLEIDAGIAELIDAETLRLQRGYYIVVPAPTSGYFANTFGGGAGLTALPLMAIAKSLSNVTIPGTDENFQDLLDQPRALNLIGRWTASACVAGSALFLFLAAARHLPLPMALFVSFAYGVGTCVYSVSSQSLWQHGPTELFLSAGIYFLSRAQRSFAWTALSGLALGFATWCRPTSVITFGAVAIYLLLMQRRFLLAFLATGVPVGLLLMVFNTTQFGGPFKFGQTELGVHAEEKTGSEEIWQTPLLYGAVASLLSPSRGLFIYSPFLVFGLAGALSIWRDRQWSYLRPLPFAVLGVWTIEFQHFDWWGGWSFGYRHIIDTVVHLAYLLIPILPAVMKRRWLRAIFSLMVIWSIAVQLIGTFLYDRWGWNCRPGYVVLMPNQPPRITYDLDEANRVVQAGGEKHFDYFNIDRPEFRSRLWSLRDSQLVYYITHAASAYWSKQDQVRHAQRTRRTRLAETYDRLGLAACALDEPEAARNFFAQALSLEPRLSMAYLHFRALAPDADLPASPRAVEVASDSNNLDRRFRTVLDLLAHDRTSAAMKLVESTAEDVSIEARGCLIRALCRLRDGHFATEISPPIQPIYQRLATLCEHFSTR